jgi:hypothetical protein
LGLASLYFDKKPKMRLMREGQTAKECDATMMIKEQPSDSRKNNRTKEKQDVNDE